MTVKTFFKKLWHKRKPTQNHSYVHENVYDANPLQSPLADPVQASQIEAEVDLSPQKDLENYANGLSVSKKSIEQLISSGLLMPDELEVAEKIVRFMRQKDQRSRE